MTMHGTKVITETLKRAGINTIFGLPGHTVHHLADEIYRDGSFRLVSPRTETGGTFMSYGFNRASHRLASACVWHIAGAPYSMPAVHAAFDDSVPLLVMYGQAESWFKGRDPIQASDHMLDSFYPIAKFTHKIEKAGLIHQALRQAILAASSGRQRPSVIEIPTDIQQDSTEAKVSDIVWPSPPSADPKSIELACKYLSQASMPVLISGGGAAASQASGPMLELAELLCAPVVYGARAGKGVIPDLHPLCFGPTGNVAWPIGNAVLEESDCWLAVGTSFSQYGTALWTLKKPANVLQIDIDAHEIGKIFSPAVGIVADAKLALDQMVSVFKAQGRDRNYDGNQRFPELRQRKEKWLGELNSMMSSSAKPINSWRIVKEMRSHLPPNGTVVTDVGQHQHWIARGFYSSTPDDVLIDSRFIILGFGVSAALGVKLARPERPVIAFVGDGGLYYSIPEFATAVSEKIPIVIVVENNGYYNSNKAVQDFVFGKRHAFSELPTSTDFVQVAKGFGMGGEVVEDPANIGPAIKRGLEKGPYLIDVKVDPMQPTKLSRQPMFRNEWDISSKPIVVEGNQFWE
ncbi:MAG TPA: thiamine pyrophosphate-binding protein [Nitrososphaerales archaeon]|nr:thiamine pyrophosphate-binding protein [Nitrososphaerales archaeon]